MKRPLILAAVGACVGTLLDYTHVASGTTAYTTPFLHNVAWWVPFLFALSGVSIGMSHVSLDARFGIDRPRPPVWKVAFGLVGLAVVWGSSGFLPMQNAWRSLVLAPLALGVWFVCDRTRFGLVLALLTSVCGVATEALLCKAGVFSYLHPDFGPVTSWLGWIYVAASVAVGNLGRALRPSPVRSDDARPSFVTSNQEPRRGEA